MIFYCVRHGESTHNAEGRLQGQSNVPGLSELGQRQAQAAAEVLAAYPVEAIYSSPLRRALETADIISRRIGLPVQTDPRLQEIDVGLFQDQRRSDVERLYPRELAGWLSGDPDFRLPGGESRNDLARRGCEALEAIARSSHEHAVVVSHGGLIVTVLKTLMGIPLSEPPLALENGSITRFAWDGSGPVEILGLNEIDHLHGIGLGGIGDLAV